VTNREREGHYQSNITISVLHYKSTARLQHTCHISILVTVSTADITLLSVRANTATHALHWLAQTLRDREDQISNTTIKTLKFYCSLSGINFCYVTTAALLTLPINHKLQSTQRSDQYTVHKINPDIHLMCELHVTVTLYRTECSLSDSD
jgi:hypothetical protein